MSQPRFRPHSLKRWLLQLGAVLLAAGCATGTPLAQTEYVENTAAEDPPARVGRISHVTGAVTLADLRDNSADTASVNWPITSQHRISTGRHGRAEVRIGSLAVRVDDESDLDFVRVDDEAIQLFLHRGSIALRLRNRDLLSEVDVGTPRERITFDDVGRYRIDVDRAGGITAVTALNGYARIAAGPMQFVVQSGQRGEVSGHPASAFRLVSYAPDHFDDWVAARDHRDDVIESRRYVSEETTGIEALDSYGAWRYVETYGNVWFPSSLPSNWAPYRHGRWAWIAPWGWTWIDEAPWGFAPSHYGRWVLVDGFWGWAPGVIVPRPVYAPALVAWFGSPGVSVSVHVGHPVGWFPLGWREVYVPYYPVSRRYINHVNAGHVINIHQITIVNPPVRFIHQRPGHATWAPGDALLRRDPIHRVVQNPPSDWTRIPTRVQPPLVVKGDVGRKRIVSNALSPNDVARPQPTPGLIAPRKPATGNPPSARPRERTAPVPGDNRTGQVRPQVPVQRPEAVQPKPAVPTPVPRAGSGAPTMVPPATPRATVPVAPGVADRPAPIAPRTDSPGMAPRPEVPRPKPPATTPRGATGFVQPPTAVQPQPTPRVAPPRDVPRVVTPRVDLPRPVAPRVETPRAHVPAPRATAPAPRVERSAPAVRSETPMRKPFARER